MTPTDLTIYNAICEKDAECRCPLVYEDAGGVWVTDVTTRASPAVMRSLITDHLHTRLESDKGCYQVSDLDGDWSIEVHWWNTGDFVESPAWVAMWVREADLTEERDETFEEIARSPSKLRAFLVAHAVRLGIEVPNE